MKKNLLILFIVVVSLVLVLSACSGKNDENNSSNNVPEPTAAPNADVDADADADVDEAPLELSGELTFWTFWVDGVERLMKPFREQHPNVTINVVEMGWSELHDNLLTTIATGSGAPDLVMIEGGFWSRFNTIEGLENLLDEPYNAWRYENDFAASNWQRWHSLDGTKLLGMPWDLPPMATYYRPDVLGEYGFPTDPQELGEFMKSTDNFMEMAQALRADDVYILEQENTIMEIYTAGPGFFDNSLDFVRNNDRFAEGIDLAKQVKQLDLSFNDCAVWCDAGKQATASGKIAMLYYASWIEGNIDSISPEMDGKWKVTELPFGNNAGGGGSTLSITSQSNNKELAWAVLESMTTTVEAQEVFIEHGGMPGLIPAWSLPAFSDLENPFLGGQKSNEIFARLMEANEHLFLATPLNEKASEIWNEGISEAIEKGLDSRAALQQIEEDIERAIFVEKQTLKANLGIR